MYSLFVQPTCFFLLTFCDDHCLHSLSVVLSLLMVNLISSSNSESVAKQ